MALAWQKLGELHLAAEKQLNHLKSAVTGGDNLDDDPFLDDRSQAQVDDRKEKKKERRLAQAEKNQEARLESLQRTEHESGEETEEENSRYGSFDSKKLNREKLTQLEKLTPLNSRSIRPLEVGSTIFFRGRLHARRRVSPKLVFFLFREQMFQVQGVLGVREREISSRMVRWAEHLPPESVVLVGGTVKKPENDVGKVESVSVSTHDVEILIERLYVVSIPTHPLPFNLYKDEVARNQLHGDSDHQVDEHPSSEDGPSGRKDKSTPDQQEHNQLSNKVRLNNRILDLREPASQIVFRINAAICSSFRSYLDNRGFIEIHTPKLQGGATESGSEVFKVDYFGRPAFLAQSPQLAKQMAIAADFGKVYEIGPVFRAENSNTHRHLTEYTGLDLEMVIDEDYGEMLDVVDGMFKELWRGVYEKFECLMPVLEGRFKHQKLVWLEDTPRIPFVEGVKMLREAGFIDDEGNPPAEGEDLGTKAEIRLGELVKEKYKTDYYILDKFPASARPFYTMADPENDEYTNSFDIMLRGQEILSGGQRIHDAKMLEKQMRFYGIHPESLEEYMEGFRLATFPHAGAGIGLERVVSLLLGLEDVRWAAIYHRDPKSLPEKPKLFELRHPEANTLEMVQPPRERNVKIEDEPPPLEKLIANYGDAANTSWLEGRYQVWRHPDNGAAVGYVVSHSFAICVGEPLCDRSQFGEVIATFLEFIEEKEKLKPIWIIVGLEVEGILGGKFDWRTLSCVAESRAQINDQAVLHDRAIRRKIRRCEKEGVKITSVARGEDIQPDIRDGIDRRVEEWLANRNGKQVRLSEIQPWRDMAHRRYLYAHDKEGTICALVVLCQLSLQNGFQIKYALDFPGAPSGTIETITLRAMEVAADEGAEQVTFGTSATSTLVPGQNMGGVRIKALSKLYSGIAEKLKLTQKGEFREKLGAGEDRTFVCYPAHGLGAKGVKALMEFLGSE